MKTKQPWFQTATSWTVFWILFVILILCGQGFKLRDTTLGVDETPDSIFRYDEKYLHKFFRVIKDDGCQFYAFTELTLDMLFPCVYGSMFFILLWKLLDSFSYRKLLLLLPMLSVIADVLENLALSYLALNPDVLSTTFSAIATFAAICTATKWSCILLSASAIVILAICKLRSRRTAAADSATPNS